MFKDNLIYLISKASTGLLSLGVLSIISHLFSNTVYGEYSIIIANSNLIIVTFFYCVRVYYIRFSKNKYGLSFKETDAIVNTIFLLSCIVSILLFFIFKTFIISLLIAFFQIKFELFQEKQRIDLKPISFFKSAITKSLLYIISIYIFSLLINNSIYSLIAAYSLPYLVIILTNKHEFTINISRDFHSIKKALSFGLPFLLTPISSTILFNYYRYCIKNSLNDSVLGGFSYVNDLSEFTIIAAMMAINLSGYPKLIKYYESGDTENFNKQSKFNLSMHFIIFLTITIFYNSFAPLLKDTIITREYYYYLEKIFYLILLGSFFKGLKIYYVDHFLLILHNKKINIISTLLYLLLSILLIPYFTNKYGLTGVTYSFVGLNMFYLLVNSVLIIKKYRIEIFNVITSASIIVITINALTFNNSILLNTCVLFLFVGSIYKLTKDESSNLLARFK